MNHFKKILKLFESFWPDGVLFLWKLDKDFNSLKGDKVKQFVLAGLAIADLLLECLEEDATVLSIVKALRLWYDIERFLEIWNIKLESEEKKEHATTLMCFPCMPSQFLNIQMETMKIIRFMTTDTFVFHGKGTSDIIKDNNILFESIDEYGNVFILLLEL